MSIEQYEKQQKALLNILDFIQSTVARSLRPYIYNLNTRYAILKVLKKCLALTDLLR